MYTRYTWIRLIIDIPTYSPEEKKKRRFQRQEQSNIDANDNIVLAVVILIIR